MGIQSSRLYKCGKRPNRARAINSVYPYNKCTASNVFDSRTRYIRSREIKQGYEILQIHFSVILKVRVARELPALFKCAPKTAESKSRYVTTSITYTRHIAFNSLHFRSYFVGTVAATGRPLSLTLTASPRKFVHGHEKRMQTAQHFTSSLSGFEQRVEGTKEKIKLQ